MFYSNISVYSVFTFWYDYATVEICWEENYYWW